MTTIVFWSFAQLVVSFGQNLKEEKQKHLKILSDYFTDKGSKDILPQGSLLKGL